MESQREEHMDSVTFEAIIDKFAAELLNRATHLTKDKDQAEDLVQDVFMDLWERREKLQIQTSISGYLHTSLKHHFLRQVSRNQLHEQAVEHLLYKMNQLEGTVLDVMAAHDLHQTLTSVLDQLPDTMQQIFKLRQEDHSLREIAQALGLAEQTVKSYHSELNRRIREAILLKHPDISHSVMLILFTCLT